MNIRYQKILMIILILAVVNLACDLFGGSQESRGNETADPVIGESVPE